MVKAAHSEIIDLQAVSAALTDLLGAHSVKSGSTEKPGWKTWFCPHCGRQINHSDKDVRGDVSAWAHCHAGVAYAAICADIAVAAFPGVKTAAAIKMYVAAHSADFEPELGAVSQ